MSRVDPATATTYADLDWDHYVQSRPTYPPSLRELILDYRRGRPGVQWTRLVDIGGGVGVSAALFAQDFDIIHLLDPSPLNCKQARVFLSQWLHKSNLHARLEFTQATAEEGHKFIKRDADLAICATAAHFMDPDLFIRSAASMLRPKGTLAVYTYWMPVFPMQSKEFTAVFTTATTRTLGLCIKPSDKVTASLFSQIAARVSAGNSVLDFLPVPDELFDDIRRVRINADAEEGMKTWKDTFPVPYESAIPQLGKNESHFVYDSREDTQAEGWYFTVDKEWLHDFLRTMRPADVELDDAQYESLYGEWDRIFEKECSSGSAQALWPVSVILATRK